MWIQYWYSRLIPRAWLMSAGRMPDPSQQAVRHPDAEHVGHGLPERRRQVVALARVVHDVDGPHAPDLVHHPVVPVVDEVPADDGGGPGQGPSAAVVALPPLPHPERVGAARQPGGGGQQARSDGQRTGHATDLPRPAARVLPAAAGDVGVVDDAVAGVVGLVGLMAGQPVGERGDGRRPHGGPDEQPPEPSLAGHHVLHQEVGGQRHDQRGHAHGEARGGVILRVVRRRRPGLRGAALQVAALRLHRPEVEGDGDDGGVGSHRPNLPGTRRGARR